MLVSSCAVPQGLGEIAFCAVAANQQVRGFGTRLMNHTKAMARDRDGLTHFLTYADNNAVGYFSKQVRREPAAEKVSCIQAAVLHTNCRNIRAPLKGKGWRSGEPL